MVAARVWKRWLSLLPAAVLGIGGTAGAAPYDLQLYQLGNPIPGAARYDPLANGNFQALARELGAGLTAAVLEPAQSLGHSGFSVQAELSVVNFSTRSSTFRMPTTQPFGGTWLMPAVHVRKGLPLSIELGARASSLGHSGMVAGTLEAKWTFVEGQPNWPALAIRGAITKLFNTPDFALQTGGVDLSASKRFPLGAAATLTPYLGYALGWTSANANIIDFDPARSAAETQRSADDAYFNTAQLKTVSASNNPYNRLYLGGRLGAGIFRLGAEVSLSLPGSFAEPESDGSLSKTKTRALPSIFAFNSSIGLDF